MLKLGFRPSNFRRASTIYGVRFWLGEIVGDVLGLVRSLKLGSDKITLVEKIELLFLGYLYSTERLQ